MLHELAQQIQGRFENVSTLLADPTVIADRERYAALGREYHQLEPAYKLGKEYQQLTQDILEAQEMLEEGEDADVRSMLENAEGQIAKVADELRIAMVESDPHDEKNVIIEVRGAAGGEEASLFAGEIYSMLDKYAEYCGYTPEALEIAAGSFTFAVKGSGAYGIFKYEAGTHRVQRVPKTESQGRLHTSTATVAVLPEAQEVEIDIRPHEVEIDVFRSSGPGGQSVNTTDSAVRLTHIESGIVVSMQDEKSQLQNKDRAFRVLRARLLERELQAQQDTLAAERSSQIGSGDRSEKIRTYNFHQDRVTDHRIGLTRNNLEDILQGNLKEFSDALYADDRRRKLGDISL